MKSFAAIGLCFIPFSMIFAQTMQVQDTFTPLPPGQIQLIGGLDNDIQNSIEHWNLGALPYSRFVDSSRWGHPQFALGEMWGKAVRSGCMFYRYTHDPRLKSVMKSAVDDLLSTTKSNGSISTATVENQPDGPGGDLWERKYVLLGLDEYYLHVEQDSRVMEAMRRQADCIINQIGHAPKVEITSLGWSPNHIESSTLLEPFMRLYNWTGDQRYLDFATYIVESGASEGYNILQQAYDNVRPREMGGPYPKAYEMMSVFEGLVEYHRVTGSEFAKKAVLNLYQNIRRYEITIIGNAGGDQPYHPSVYGEAWDDTALEQTNPDIKRMMETCVGVTWMKFCSQYLRLTGDPAAVDCIEKYVYNGLLGAMRPDGKGFSYVNLLNGSKVTNHGWGMNIDGLPVTCCNLSGPTGLAYIPYVAVMRSAEGPVVNLYNRGVFKTETPDGRYVSLGIDTDFPRSGDAKIAVFPSGSGKFTIKLYIPSWSSSTTVSVNGKPIRDVRPGTYLPLVREWKAGDEIKVSFDMKARLIQAPEGINPAGKNFQAVQWGPLVLARDENIDPEYDKPVRIVADPEGIVDARIVDPERPGTRMQFIVPTTTGPIKMVDYSSVDCWEGSHIQTWLPLPR